MAVMPLDVLHDAEDRGMSSSVLHAPAMNLEMITTINVAPVSMALVPLRSALLPFADGKTALLADADVGAAAATVLANPEPHIGKFYDLTGLQSLTMAQYAQEFSGVLGRTIQYFNVPPQSWEANLREARLPEHLIAHLNTMGQLNRDNRYDRMNDSFQQVVGRAPISAAEFARRHAAAFTPQTRASE
ncbi:MAG TPA: hypothetical protein VGL53_18235 [Bryobacteraceae bacterium]|jgi:uncharacterized protein YbjT (DUF2867 family)